MCKRALVVAFLMIGAGLSAWAQSVEDDMTAWATASAAQKSRIVDDIMSGASAPGHVSRTELLDCLDQTSRVSGHRHLLISEVAEACLHPSGPGDQAKAGTAGGRTTISDEHPGTANSGSVWSKAWNE